MGDTGSLAIGGAVAGFAILSRTELLLAFIGGLFVLITLSVIIQVGYFKITKGKRFFKMAPLQHHFELKGWAEVTVVVRFWILAGLFVAAGPGHLLRRMGGAAVTGPIPAALTTRRGSGPCQLGLRLGRPARRGHRHRRSPVSPPPTP